jgi:hypothetical protein
VTGPRYVDEGGQRLGFRAQRDFREGLSATQNEATGLWGYRDTDGKWAIDAEYDFAGDFDGGFAMVVKDEKRGYVDRKGALLSGPPSWDEASPFSAGYAIASLDDAWGFCDPKGAAQVTPRFATARAFSEGWAAVAFADASGEKWWTFVDPSGNIVTDRQFRQVDDLHEGFAAVEDSSYFALLGRDGRYIPVSYSSMPTRVSDGIFASEIEGAWSFFSIDAKDPSSVPKPAFSGAFEAAGPFSEGRAPVRRDGAWGFVDETGNLAVPCRYQSVAAFSGSLAFAQGPDGTRSYLDPSGKAVWQER